ncbi:protein kinase-like domain-containing protein [Xylariomycetidae sp. FL0641]|nr:protein kinase-like domain-containing protein [Xylariomycetidae sp. FL0641]
MSNNTTGHADIVSEINIEVPEPVREPAAPIEYISAWPRSWEDVGIEDVTGYNIGGFHPVHLGDILQDRFEVVHKLGNGGFGTVWCCQDRQLGKWRAIKILSAKHSVESQEVEILRHLADRSTPEELEACHVLLPLETFWLDGPNGRHLCLVMPIHGCNLSDWRGHLDSESESTAIEAKRICAQIATGIQLLHEKGICHGDLKPSNILMKVDQDALNKLDKKGLLKLLGEPELWEIETESGQDPKPRAPAYAVIEPSVTWCEGLITKAVSIVDFGESFFAGNPSETTGIPILYAPPEMFFGRELSLGMDIWSLACIFYQVRFSQEMFGDTFHGASFARMVHEFEVILGILPEPLREIYQKEDRGGPEGAPIPTEEDEEKYPGMAATCSLASLRLARNRILYKTGYDDVLDAWVGQTQEFCKVIQAENGDVDYETRRISPPREEASSLASLLRGMLRYEPTERSTITAVTQHPWLHHD